MRHETKHQSEMEVLRSSITLIIVNGNNPIVFGSTGTADDGADVWEEKRSPLSWRQCGNASPLVGPASSLSFPQTASALANIRTKNHSCTLEGEGCREHLVQSSPFRDEETEVAPP